MGKHNYLKYLNNQISDVIERKVVDRADKVIILRSLKNDLPEGFIQRRIVSTNYMVLRNMYNQRRAHRLIEWKQFCEFLTKSLRYSNLISATKTKR